MFALLLDEDCRPPEAPLLRTEYLFGVPFAIAYVHAGGGWLSCRRCAALARKMRRAGVRHGVFPAAFSGMAIFEKAGIAALDDSALRHAGAVQMAAALLRCGGESESVGAVLLGETLSAPLIDTLTALCRFVRYLYLAVPSGGEELCAALRREYGVCVQRGQGMAAAAAKSILLTYDGTRPFGSAQTIWLPQGSVRVCPGFVDAADRFSVSLPAEMEAQLPAGGNRSVLISLFLREGALNGAALQWTEKPEKLDRAGRILYNGKHNGIIE